MSIYKKENPDYFRIALKSIFEQSLKTNEIVIMVAGELTEELEELLKEIQNQHKEIKICRFDQQIMLGRALRKGVELCSNQLIASMDTDDIARDNRL